MLKKLYQFYKRPLFSALNTNRETSVLSDDIVCFSVMLYIFSLLLKSHTISDFILHGIVCK